MKRTSIALIVLLLVILDVLVWFEILLHGPADSLELYFLNVGQGDAELVILPGGAKILIDGGPNNLVLDRLSSALSPLDRYIDLVVSTHPQLDHFNGLIDVLKRYKVGLFISDGKAGQAQSFSELKKALEENKARQIVLGEGDKIMFGKSKLDVISPSYNLLQSSGLNDWGLVLKLTSGGAKALFTADVSSQIESELVKKYDLDIDILKVAHHGSRFSTSNEFLKEATPEVAVIEVGKNTYGHPTEQTLKRLYNAGVKVFRTDQDGTVKLIVLDSKIAVSKEK